MNASVYKRVLLKYSGEALMGAGSFGIDPQVIQKMATEIKPLIELKVALGVIIGGGNFLRGATFTNYGIDRVTSDHMGIMATGINALAIRDVFQKMQIATCVLSAVAMPGILEQYSREKVFASWQHNQVVILAGGTGNPLVTTDSALSLRGIELQADLLLKATSVDGVYSADPHVDPAAQRYTKLSYQEALAKELKVMDLGAFSQCRDHNMRLRVFNMHTTGALLNIILGKDEGTLLE